MKYTILTSSDNEDKLESNSVNNNELIFVFGAKKATRKGIFYQKLD